MSRAPRKDSVLPVSLANPSFHPTLYFCAAFSSSVTPKPGLVSPL
jgi:hypothetical protein